MWIIVFKKRFCAAIVGNLVGLARGSKGLEISEVQNFICLMYFDILFFLRRVI